MKKRHNNWTVLDGTLYRGIDDATLRRLLGKRPPMSLAGYIAVTIALALAIGIVYQLSIRYGW